MKRRSSKEKKAKKREGNYIVCKKDKSNEYKTCGKQRFDVFCFLVSVAMVNTGRETLGLLLVVFD